MCATDLLYELTFPRGCGKRTLGQDSKVTKHFSGMLERKPLGTTNLSLRAPEFQIPLRVFSVTTSQITCWDTGWMELQGHLMPTSINAILVLRSTPLIQ